MASTMHPFKVTSSVSSTVLPHAAAHTATCVGIYSLVMGMRF